MKLIIDVDAATLTPDLGELCPGQDVVLTCSTGDGDIMSWLYNGMTLGTSGAGTPSLFSSDPINTTRDLMGSGFMFSLVLTSRMPEFASTLSFEADAAMNGGNVSCRVLIGSDNQESAQILRIIAGKCCDIVVKILNPIISREVYQRNVSFHVLLRL